MKNSVRVFLTILLVSLACVGSAERGFAQSATGTIVGRVEDPQGAAVPNATVTARNVDTGIERNTTTTAEGLFRISGLQPAVYEVRVEAAGFAKALTNGVKIQVGDLRDLNFKLTLATMAS